MSEGGRWAIYTRLSLAAADGGSHAMQVADCRRWVARAGGVIALEESDDESGLVAARPGYQRLLAAARRGEIDGVIVWRYDRFGRSLGESASRVEEFEARGIKVVSATEGDNPTVRDVMFALAKDESRRISLRVKPRMAQLVQSGRYIAPPPFGYRLTSDSDGRRHLVIRPDEAELYRRMADRYLAGESLRAICAWARAQVDGEGRPFRTSRGKPITPVYLRTAITNPIYAGTVRWNRYQKSKVFGSRPLPESEHIRVPEAAPAIIDVDQHLAILAEHARREPNHGQARASAFGLTGLLVCRCGEKMYGSYSAARQTSRGVYYYRCASQLHGRGCGTPNMRGLALEWEVAAAILDPAILTGATAERLAAQRAAHAGADPGAKRRESLRRDIARQRGRISEATTLLIDGVIDREEYARQVAAFEEARRAAERELAGVTAAPKLDARAFLAAIRILPANLAALTVSGRRRLFRATVDRAEWDGGGLAVEWAQACQALLGEVRRSFPNPPLRKRHGYALWGRDDRQ